MNHETLETPIPFKVTFVAAETLDDSLRRYPLIGVAVGITVSATASALTGGITISTTVLAAIGLVVGIVSVKSHITDKRLADRALNLVAYCLDAEDGMWLRRIVGLHHSTQIAFAVLAALALILCNAVDGLVPTVIIFAFLVAVMTIATKVRLSAVHGFLRLLIKRTDPDTVPAR